MSSQKNVHDYTFNTLQFFIVIHHYTFLSVLFRFIFHLFLQSSMSNVLGQTRPISCYILWGIVTFYSLWYWISIDQTDWSGSLVKLIGQGNGTLSNSLPTTNYETGDEFFFRVLFSSLRFWLSFGNGWSDRLLYYWRILLW